ncbi:MAG: DNA-binding response regulator [Thermodesulfobacteriota bacterium]|nr:DNA-binding response regulator [Thermodesulfobacteriota bacterium]
MKKKRKVEEDITSVVIFEKEGTFLEQIKDAVESDPGLKIIDASVDLRGAAALMKIIKEAPDVILIGFDILKEAAASNAGALLKLRKKMPETRLIVMCERYADEEMLRMINEGIRGFFLSGTPPGLITKCIRVVLAGEMWIEGAFVARTFEGMSRRHMMEKGQEAKGYKIRVVIFDEDRAFVEDLKKNIGATSDIEIADVHGDIEETTELIFKTEEPIDLILVSFNILKEVAASNMETLTKLKTKLPETRVVVMGERYVEEEIFRMVKEGIRGFFVKGDISSEFITKCVRVVAAGEIWMDSKLVSRVFEEFSRYFSEAEGELKSPSPEDIDRLSLLTKRERELLGLVSRSLTNDEIAERLFISTETVKTHVRNIFEKLGSRNRVDATLLYIGASERREFSGHEAH